MKKIIVPGYQGSPKGHWQHWLQEQDSTSVTVVQDSWEFPEVSAWVARLEEVISSIDEPIQLIGHSMGCITIAFWAAQFDTLKVLSTVLVAPADSESANLPKAIQGFGDIPVRSLPFLSTLIGSHTDPYMSFERALHFANQWGSDFIDAGDAGHINSDSGYNEWPELLPILNNQEISIEYPALSRI
jgi:uncharacterized protein